MPFDPAERFSDDVRVVRPAAADETPEFALSTPLMRRAMVRELKARDRRAAVRRRWAFLLDLLALVVVGGLAIAGLLPVWAPAIPLGLLPLLVLLVRVNVSSMNRARAEVLAEVRGATDEETVMISREELDAARSPGSASTVSSVVIGAPEKSTGGLWESIPVTAPTYVQAPTPPRTVRTIDLSAPPIPKPVTADPRSAASADVAGEAEAV